MRRLCSLVIIAAAASLITLSLRAQTSTAAPRISGPVNESSLIALKGNVTPLARAQFDQGEAPPAAELRSMRLVLSSSLEQTAALDKLMAEQLDKSSPNYHKWLTPEQFGKLYGPADSDIAAIVAWLQSHGLTVDEVSTGRTNIAFSGTVRQVEEAFHTTIHTYEAVGRQFYSNTSDPRIPAALAPLVTGIAHLNTLDPRPQLAASPSGMFDQQAGHFAPLENENRLARPELTTGNGFLWIVPADAATIYDTPNSYNAAFSSGTSYTGKGVTIGVGGDAAVNPATVVNYRQRFLNDDTTAPIITNVHNSAIAGNATDEAYLDLELSGGIAPGATIHFYTDSNSDGGLGTAVNQALTENTVDIFSLSFGLCEYYFPTSDNQLISNFWKQAAAQGIAVTVSTGDSGSAGCDDPNSVTVASNGLQVNGWASTPYNIAVGGTDTHGLVGNFATYANNNQSSTNSYRSAKSYIPESTWNDSTSVNGLLANNVSAGSIVAGSGGVSACSTNTDSIVSNNFVLGVCTNGYAKPTWQRGTGVPSDNARDLPDISLMAGNGIDAATWLVCTDDINGSSYPENCADQTNGSFYFAGFGGTSTSAPAFAGILALVQEAQGGSGHRLGLDGAKTLYDIYNTSHASTVFHDVTQGNNSVVCTANSPNCKLNTAGYNFLTGYNTTAGYDLATGIGSVDATQLVKFWLAGSGSATSTVTATPTPATLTIAQSLQVAVTVTGSGSLGTPTGTVTLSGGGYTSSAQNLDSTGAYTFTVPAGSLTAGTDTLTVTYSGDTNYATTAGTTSVTVTALATPTVTVTPPSSSIFVNQSLAVTITVAGTSGGPTPTGNITLSSGTYTSPATPLANGTVSITIPANSLALGTDTLTATYSGDTNYSTATGMAPVTVNPAGATATVMVTPDNASIDTSQSLNVTVAVTGTSGVPPTGNVTLTGGGYTSAATPLDSTGKAIFAISANTFSAANSLTLTATYIGDSVYAPATGTANITIAQTTFALAASTPAGVNPGTAATSTITVSSSTNYSGTVTLACALATSPTGATNLPTCAVTGSPVTLSATTSSAAATVTISTTAATTANLERRGLPARTGIGAGAGGGALLALLFFVGMPARRRSWRNLLGLLVLFAALGSLSACGGGGGNGGGNGGGGGGNPGTTAGTYTFTVTGTATPSVSPAPTATVTLTVN